LNSGFYPKHYPADDAGATARGGTRSRHHARKPLSKFHRLRINRLHASQNAAALLIDPDKVDIRVSGDSIQRILVVGCSESNSGRRSRSRAAMNYAQV
jgi:hypothetical protein